MTNILCGEKDAERKTIQEISCGKKASNGSEYKPSPRFHKSRYISDLGDVIHSVTTILFKERHELLVLTTAERVNERSELLVDLSPCFDLVFCVLNMRDFFTVGIGLGDLS